MTLHSYRELVIYKSRGNQIFVSFAILVVKERKNRSQEKNQLQGSLR